MSNKQQSFYLKSDDERIACTALIPENAAGAVLMLLPFVEERKGALPQLLNIARKLHKNNVASLIFDWRGTGDSSGEFENINPAEFSTDIQTALTWLKENTGNVPITAIGVRLSAFYLLQLNHPDVTRLILVSPVSGDEFMRQLLQRRMVNDMVAYGKAVESRASLVNKLKSGNSVDLDGYEFTSQFYKWVLKNTEIRNTEYGMPDNKSKRPTSNDAKATSHILHPTSHNKTLLIPGGHSRKTAGQIAEVMKNIETAELRFPPFWNTVGHVDLSELINSITEWITGKEAEKAVRQSAARELRPVWSESAPISTEDMQLIDILDSGSTIRAAVNSPKRRPEAGVLFLHGWSGDRSGPHRIFVRAAHKFTAEGSLCLRPDFRGRGLSDEEHTNASIASMADDAEVALEKLKQLLPAHAPVYVAAICSGCKIAVALASRHPEIQKMLLLSAESMGSLRSAKTNSRKTRNALGTYLKKLTQLETWKKIATGRVQTKLVTKALVKYETRSDDEAKAEDRILEKFKQFSNPIHFVFGGSDPDAPGSMKAYKAYCEKYSIPYTMHIVPDAGHSYYSVKWTENVLDSGNKFLKS
ncbi:MAG: alpha/beta hydrolase [Kiritimatiellia bacterium]